jgi:hypothetical protein
MPQKPRFKVRRGIGITQERTGIPSARVATSSPTTCPKMWGKESGSTQLGKEGLDSSGGPAYTFIPFEGPPHQRGNIWGELG